MTIATEQAPWSQRNLATGSAILEDLRKAKANLRVAQQAEKQAVAAFKDAVADGELAEFFNDLDETYCAPGITVTFIKSTRYSEKGYSDTLRKQMEAERENGIATATVVESMLVKLSD